MASIDIKPVLDEVTAELAETLAGVKLTPEEFAIVQRASDRLAEYAMTAPFADAATRRGLERRMKLDIATLQNLAASKQIELESQVRAVAIPVIRSFMETGFRLIAPTVASA